MKELQIQNSCLKATVDDEDYERLSKFVWYINKNFSIGRMKSLSYRIYHTSLASEIMHQPKQMFDHKDRDPLNNQKENLRPCSYSQNGGNRKKQKGTSSIYKGVSYFKRDNKWRASITKDQKYESLGHFDIEIEAAKAYNARAKELFGEFASLNPV